MTEFEITASCGENGTISPFGSMLVVEGESLIFTITPSFGHVPAVVVDGYTVGPLTSYTFSNVQEEHSINVVFNTIPFSIAQFRLDLKEFTDEVKFPGPSITFWAGVGGALLNVDRWGELYSYGLELFVAHNLALQFLDQASINAGGAPGVGFGLINNQSAGGVSVGIDTTAALEEGAGNYNLTVYGLRLKRLIDIVGCGGVQLI